MDARQLMVQIVEVLLNDLEDALMRRDGDAAVRVIERIRAVAGDAIADYLLISLIAAGLKRIAANN
jgi:phosphate uptake regulator